MYNFKQMMNYGGK